MSQLIRFKIGTDDFFTKAVIYERHSRKQECAVCGQRRWGILVRHKAPKKIKDTMICLECIVQISLGMTIDLGEGNKFGRFNESRFIGAAKRRRKAQYGENERLGTKPKHDKDQMCPVPNCGQMFSGHGLKMHLKFKHPEFAVEQKDTEPVTEPPVNEPASVPENDVEPIVPEEKKEPDGAQ